MTVIEMFFIILVVYILIGAVSFHLKVYVKKPVSLWTYLKFYWLWAMLWPKLIWISSEEWEKNVE